MVRAIGSFGILTMIALCFVDCTRTDRQSEAFLEGEAVRGWLRELFFEGVNRPRISGDPKL